MTIHPVPSQGCPCSFCLIFRALDSKSIVTRTGTRRRMQSGTREHSRCSRPQPHRSKLANASRHQHDAHALRRSHTYEHDTKEKPR